MAPSVLLIRTNAYGELFNTRDAVEAVRAHFGAAEVVALATPQSEGRALLEADPRHERVLVFPSRPEEPKSPAAFRSFLTKHRFDAVVACVGATPGMDYGRHLLSLLLCPGCKCLMDGTGRIFPLLSVCGLGLMARTLASSLADRLTRAALARRRPCAPLSRRLDLRRETVRRILWIRLDGIGDVVMTLPALAMLRAQFPQAQIDLLVRPLSVPLARCLPGIGVVHAFEPGDAPRSTRNGERQNLVSLAFRLRRNAYDLAVDIAGRDPARLLAFLSGARLRVSPAVSRYDDPFLSNLSFLMTHPVPSEGDRTLPAAATFQRLLERLGLPPAGQSDPFAFSEDLRANVDAKRQTLGVTRPYALIHACSAEHAKDWRPERFARVAEALQDRYGLDVLLTGTGRDRDDNARILAHAAQTAHLHNAAGVFDLPELPALCREARLMVTVDTGPMHIAAAVGTPLVALFLPWFAQRDSPREQEGGVLTPFPERTVPPEHAADFWAGDLLRGITVDDVLQAIDGKLNAPADHLARAA